MTARIGDWESSAGCSAHIRVSRRTLLKSALVLATVPTATGARASSTERGSRWIKFSDNPILTLGEEGDFDSQNIMSPSVVKSDGQYYLFYAGGPSGPANGGPFVRYQIGLAVSDDGQAWQKTGKPLFPLGLRDNFHATPALLRFPTGELAKPGNRWHLVFCGNREDDVEYRTSSDGLHWQKAAETPIYRNAYAPNLVQLEDEVRMYFVHKPEAADGQERPWEIHLATGRDLFSLKPHAANPMLVISQPWEERALFYPYVLREENTWIMFYAAYWQDGPIRPATAIGMATSRDGVVWEKHAGNPVVMPTAGSHYDSRYTSSQAIIRDGDEYKMYYGSRIDMQHKYYAIALATMQGPILGTSDGTK